MAFVVKDMELKLHKGFKVGDKVAIIGSSFARCGVKDGDIGEIASFFPSGYAGEVSLTKLKNYKGRWDCKFCDIKLVPPASIIVVDTCDCSILTFTTIKEAQDYIQYAIDESGLDLSDFTVIKGVYLKVNSRTVLKTTNQEVINIED